MALKMLPNLMFFELCHLQSQSNRCTIYNKLMKNDTLAVSLVDALKVEVCGH